MMGRQTSDQSQLFYLFNLGERIPAGHLLRRINPIVTRVLAEPQIDAIVANEILRPLGFRPSLEVGRGAYDRHSHVGADANRNHILRNLLTAPHACIVLFRNDVA